MLQRARVTQEEAHHSERPFAAIGPAVRVRHAASLLRHAWPRLHDLGAGDRRVSGTVVDASGQVVPGATVTLTNEGTASSRSAR